MNAVKEEVIRIVESLPDDCSYEDVQYQIYVREKIERGMRDIEAGRVVPHEDVEQQIEEWLK